MVGRQMKGDELGRSHGPVEVLSRDLPGGNEENYAQSSEEGSRANSRNMVYVKYNIAQYNQRPTYY
jgi:hypothetical protein